MMFLKARITLRVAITFVMIAVLFSLGPSDKTQASHSDEDSSDAEDLQKAFEEAAKEFQVPESVLMSVGYNLSRWHQHNGEPSTSGGYGIMHLTQLDEISTDDAKGDDNNQTGHAMEEETNFQTLDEAAELLDVKPEELKNDAEQNIRGGAALLAEYAEETTEDIPDQAEDWYGAVAEYSSSNNEQTEVDFADQVYSTIQEGAEQTVNDQHITLSSEDVKPNKETAQSQDIQQSSEDTPNEDVDCPDGLDCEYIPAAYEKFSDSERDYGNYDLADRPDDGLDIRYIVIHDTEGSFDSAVSTFQGPSYTSANYVVRSSDGKIAQMVRPENAAWQAGNWHFNAHSLGIEHEGFAIEGATWFSEPMYQASAELVKYLADRYDVPLDREHIIGHDNVPGLSPTEQSDMHWDPATYWDWDHYLDLLGAEPDEAPSHKGESWEANGVVTIQPDFETNQPPVTNQDDELEPQPSNFVYLRTEPDDDAPRLSDPAMHPEGEEGTTLIFDWGDKAVAGQHFYRVDRDGDWSAIDYAGEKAWFYDPRGENSDLTNHMVITPKNDSNSIPVYGAPYPEDSAYEGTDIDEADRGELEPLQYEISEDQKYVAEGPVQSDYYYSKVYDNLSDNQFVKGDDEFYQISFNHRLAFVKKDDVDIVAESTDDIDAVVTNFDDMNVFENDQIVHDLQLHLQAVSHFEEQEMTEKVIKHLEGFKDLLEHDKNNDMISSQVYDTLQSTTDSLIEEKDK